eukprot:jgi/Mesen1/6090/ME000031S05361
MSGMALENMDFAPHVLLKKLTLDFIGVYFLNFPDECSITISTTLSELAGLQELHIKAENLAAVATLPPWLAELLAFYGVPDSL